MSATKNRLPARPRDLTATRDQLAGPGCGASARRCTFCHSRSGTKMPSAAQPMITSARYAICSNGGQKFTTATAASMVATPHQATPAWVAEDGSVTGGGMAGGSLTGDLGVMSLL